MTGSLPVRALYYFSLFFVFKEKEKEKAFMYLSHAQIPNTSTPPNKSNSRQSLWHWPYDG